MNAGRDAIGLAIAIAGGAVAFRSRPVNKWDLTSGLERLMPSLVASSTQREQSPAMKNLSSASPSRLRPARAEAGLHSTRTRTREFGLELIQRINRWLVAGAVAAVGLFSLLAAHAFHGTFLTSGSSGSSAASQSRPAAQLARSRSSSGNSGLQPPAQAPSSAPAALAPVVSGGS